MFRGETKEDDHDDTTDEFLVKATAGVAAGAAFAYGVYKLFTRSSSESSSTANVAATPARSTPPDHYHLGSSSRINNMEAHHARAQMARAQMESSSPTNTVKHYWTPPQEGWIKINTDASLRDNNSSVTIGGVIRDDDSDWIQGFTGKVNSGSAFTIGQAELYAINQGLSLAWNLGFRKVEVETDSEPAMRLINKEKVLNDHIFEDRLILAYRDLHNKRWTVRLKHCKREANTVADYMAKLGHSSGDFGITSYREPPNDQADYYFNRDLDRLKEGVSDGFL